MGIFKKRASVWLVLILTLAILFSFAAGAEESVAPQESVSTEETLPPTEDAERESESDPAPVQTVLTRLWEYVNNNQEKILQWLEMVALAAFAWYSKNKNKIMISGLQKTVNGQASVVDASDKSSASTQKMITAQEAFAERLRHIEESAEERDRINKATLYDVSVLLQMVYTLSLNNANIPQPIKDCISAFYAKGVSATENDDRLHEAIKQMRDTLGLLSKKEGVENEAADT